MGEFGVDPVVTSATTYANQNGPRSCIMHLSANKGSVQAASQRSGASRRHQPVAAAAVTGPMHRTTPQAQLPSQTGAAARPQSLAPRSRAQQQRVARGLVAAAAAGSSADAEVYDTVVVGAGISGLVTAQALMTKHGDAVKSFLVTEGRERVGGNITSMQGEGYVWEEGPNSFQPNDSMLQAAVRRGGGSSGGWSVRETGKRDCDGGGQVHTETQLERARAGR